MCDDEQCDDDVGAVDGGDAMKAQGGPGQDVTSEYSTVLRVAFVGCGNIAKYHVHAALAAGRVSITALVDPNHAARKQIADAIRKLRV